MKSILRGLYNGEIIPWERKEPRDEEVHELIRKIEIEEQYFMQKLSPDDSQRFQTLSNLYSSLSMVSEENVFSYGFTLGLLLGEDIANEAKLLFNK